MVRLGFCWLSGLWVMLFAAIAQDVLPSDEKLVAIQAELKARQQTLADSQATAEQLQTALRTSDNEIALLAKNVNYTESDLAQVVAEQKKLQTEQRRLQSAIETQQQQLASQIKSAYMVGQYDYVKLFFYQQDAAKFERMLTYYQYLSRARQDAINAFQADVVALLKVNEELQAKAAALDLLRSQQHAQQMEMLTRQADRRQTLARLKQQINSEKAKVDALLATEQGLLKAIETARRAAEKAAREVVVMSGLAQRKGKLLVPAEGQVRALYGKRRQGQVSWNGIVIEGNEGTPVRAVSEGRVLYADWLRGMGLVTIVDHGEGYMSVYGHNQALLKQAGDIIVQGETIALVGQSGGQDNPTLYFELRHKGKPLNPSQWLALK